MAMVVPTDDGCAATESEESSDPAARLSSSQDVWLNDWKRIGVFALVVTFGPVRTAASR